MGNDDNALVALVEMRRARARRLAGEAGGLQGWLGTSPGFCLIFGAFLWCLMTGVFSAISGRSLHGSLEAVQGGLAFLMMFYVPLIALGIPLGQLSTCTNVLASLRAGRGLTELVGTGIEPRTVVDGLSLWAARMALKRSLLYLPGLAVGCCLAGADPIWVLYLTLLALPVIGCIVLGTSYVCLLSALFGGDGQGGTVLDGPLKVGASLLAFPSIALLVFGFSAVNDLGRQPVTATGQILLAALLYLVLHAVASRPLALLALDRLPQLGQRLGQAGRRLLSRHRNRWMRSWSQNPIDVRETARQAQCTPGGILGLVLLRMPLVWLFPLIWAVVGPYAFTASEAALFFWVFMVLGSLISMIAVLRVTSQALVSEVENGTLDTLRHTRLTVRELCDGWLLNATSVRYAELLLISPFYVYLAIRGEVGFDAVVAAGLLLLTPISTACAGLWCSAAFTRQGSSTRLSNLMVGALIGFVMTSVLEAAVLLVLRQTQIPSSPPAVSAFVVLVCVALFTRWMLLKQLSQAE